MRGVTAALGSAREQLPRELDPAVRTAPVLQNANPGSLLPSEEDGTLADSWKLFWKSHN